MGTSEAVGTMTAALQYLKGAGEGLFTGFVVIGQEIMA